MDGYKIHTSLEENLPQPARVLHLGRRLIFQHDSDLKHKANTIQEWLQNNNVNVLEWPSWSPDPNPVATSQSLRGFAEKNGENFSVQMYKADTDLST